MLSRGSPPATGGGDVRAGELTGRAASLPPAAPLCAADPRAAITKPSGGLWINYRRAGPRGNPKGRFRCWSRGLLSSPRPQTQWAWGQARCLHVKLLLESCLFPSLRVGLGKEEATWGGATGFVGGRMPAGSGCARYGTVSSTSANAVLAQARRPGRQVARAPAADGSKPIAPFASP